MKYTETKVVKYMDFYLNNSVRLNKSYLKKILGVSDS